MSTPPSAEGIEQVAFGFMASKVLFSAIEFGLFTELAKRVDGRRGDSKALRTSSAQRPRLPRHPGGNGDARTKREFIRKYRRD